MRTIITPKPEWLVRAEQTRNAAKTAGQPFKGQVALRETVKTFVRTVSLDILIDLILDLSERSDDLELEARRWGGSQG